MSIIRITITEDHIKLLEHLRWSVNKGGFLLGTEDEEIDPAPFGENTLYEGIDLLLNGKNKDINPFEMEDFIEYTDEQKAEWDKLYYELPMALSVILQRKSFETGTFKAKYHDQIWKKVS